MSLSKLSKPKRERANKLSFFFFCFATQTAPIMEENILTGVIIMNGIKDIVKVILDKPGSTAMVLSAVAEVLAVVVKAMKKGS